MSDQDQNTETEQDNPPADAPEQEPQTTEPVPTEPVEQPAGNGNVHVEVEQPPVVEQPQTAGDA
jgi:hypothetical protein